MGAATHHTMPTPTRPTRNTDILFYFFFFFSFYEEQMKDMDDVDNMEQEEQRKTEDDIWNPTEKLCFSPGWPGRGQQPPTAWPTRDAQ